MRASGVGWLIQAIAGSGFAVGIVVRHVRTGMAAGHVRLEPRLEAIMLRDAGPTQAVSTGVRVGVRRRGAGRPAILRAPVAPHVEQALSCRRFPRQSVFDCQASSLLC